MNRSIHTKISFVSVAGYMFLLIVLPVGTIFEQAFSGGVHQFIHAVIQPIGVAALRVTVETALIAAIINTIAGTFIAYALVRTQLPGKSILNALVDLPFAIPTTVSGIMLVLLYGPSAPLGIWLAHYHIQLVYSTAAIILAMVFVTFPYTIRAVQPLLEDIDVRMEEAASTLGASGWRIMKAIILPTLMPGILSGFTLIFSRSMAELGAVVVISGNLPMHTQVAAVYLYGLLENYDQQGAAAISVVLLAISFLALVYQLYMLKQKPQAKLKHIASWFTKKQEGSDRYEASDRAV